MLGLLGVKQESSYQPPIDPPGSHNTASAWEIQDLEGQSGLFRNDSASRGEALDVSIEVEVRVGKNLL